jgi:hypothetical protein
MSKFHTGHTHLSLVGTFVTLEHLSIVSNKMLQVQVQIKSSVIYQENLTPSGTGMIIC